LLYPATDNGGSPAANYHLLRNDGEGGAIFAAISAYNYSAHGFQHTVALTSESMTAGKHYQFVYRAENIVGVSTDSAVATFPVADAPAKPASAPRLSMSNKTSITVAWDKAPDTQTPAGQTTGHYLYVDDGAQGSFSLVFSGAGYPELTSYTVSSLTTGHPYRFYAVAENYVGLNVAASDIATHWACQAPSGLEPPVRIATTQTQVELSWSAPADDGGCAITGYAILLGDEKNASASGEIPYAEVHATDVRDKPTLSSFNVTSFPAGTVVSANLRFKLIAFNQGGFNVASANSTRVELAAVPSAPTGAPVRDNTTTSGSVIRVTYSAPPSDGGSNLTGYEVQMDDGLGGGFSTVAGGVGKVYLKTYFIALGSSSCNYTSPCTQSQVSTGLDGQQYTETVTTMSLTKGLTYRFRYRAANNIGWSSWSPISSVQAATAPEAPSAPTVISTGPTFIYLQINPSLENNGDPIERYSLYIDGGALNSSFTVISNYSDSGDFYNVTATNGSLVSGEKYRFVATATNSLGESAFSQEVRAAVGTVPSQPAKLARSYTLSTRTQLTITWSIAPDTEIPITGYVLEWDQAEGDGTYYELWNGRGKPEVLSYTVPVTTGSKYSFRHKAVNFNGDSVYSDVLETYACISPTAPGQPTWITSTSTSISLSWTGAVDDGGCPIIEYRLYRDAGDGSGNATTEVHQAELQGNSAATG